MSSPWPMPGELSVTFMWAPSELAVSSNSSLGAFATKRIVSEMFIGWETSIRPCFVNCSWGYAQLTVNSFSFLWAFHAFATLTISSLLPLHGESSDDITNISQKAHSVSLKFFEFFCFSQWLMTETFKQTNRKHTTISQRELYCELTVR